MKMMSFALMSMMVILMAAFNTSCSDDDNGIDSPIVGTWVTGNTLLGITSTITFNANGTVTSVDEFDGESFTDSGTYTVSGNVIHIDWGDEEVVMRFTMSGDTMVTTMDGEEGSTTWTRQ